MITINGFGITSYKRFPDSKFGRSFHAVMTYEGKRLMKFDRKEDGITNMKVIQTKQFQFLKPDLEQLLTSSFGPIDEWECPSFMMNLLLDVEDAAQAAVKSGQKVAILNCGSKAAVVLTDNLDLSVEEASELVKVQGKGAPMPAVQKIIEVFDVVGDVKLVL